MTTFLSQTIRSAAKKIKTFIDSISRSLVMFICILYIDLEILMIFKVIPSWTFLLAPNRTIDCVLDLKTKVIQTWRNSLAFDCVKTTIFGFLSKIAVWSYSMNLAIFGSISNILLNNQGFPILLMNCDADATKKHISHSKNSILHDDSVATRSISTSWTIGTDSAEDVETVKCATAVEVIDDGILMVEPLYETVVVINSRTIGTDSGTSTIGTDSAEDVATVKFATAVEVIGEQILTMGPLNETVVVINSRETYSDNNFVLHESLVPRDVVVRKPRGKAKKKVLCMFGTVISRLPASYGIDLYVWSVIQRDRLIVITTVV